MSAKDVLIFFDVFPLLPVASFLSHTHKERQEPTKPFCTFLQMSNANWHLLWQSWSSFKHLAGGQKLKIDTRVDVAACFDILETEKCENGMLSLWIKERKTLFIAVLRTYLVLVHPHHLRKPTSCSLSSSPYLPFNSKLPPKARS